MCDYSLHGLPNRLAEEGEELVAHRFITGAIGLTSPAELRRAAHRDTPRITQASRRGLERALDLALWLELYTPEVSLT